MKLFNELQLIESQKASAAEVSHSVKVINKIYNEWRKTKRRINAVDLVTTSVNKLATLHPEVVPLLNEEMKLKLVTLLMRSMDIPPWKPINTKASIYKKIYPLLSKLQTSDPNTGSGGNLREVVMTRLSAAVSHANKSGVFVAYEPVISNSYLRYIFGDDIPEKVYKMQAMSLPDDFESLESILTINHEKAEERLTRSKKGLKEGIGEH